MGPILYRRLLHRYGSAGAALLAIPDLARSGGRTNPPAIPSAAAALREIEGLARLGARLLFLGDALYPPLLARLDDAPPAIAVHGDPAHLARRAVALVGSRNASANGQRIAEQLAHELAAAGLVVVSGLARGVDAAAHTGALSAGSTVACVAGGLDMPYPPEHAALQARIAEKGAVLAEAPLGTAPQSRHFPRRNRIIAGLSLGVVVVEAALKSGSLITARLAQDAHRELFAVPGSPLDPRCRGANDLIRQGATLVETASDILDHLPDDPGREGLSRLPLFARKASAPGSEPGSGPGLAEPLPDVPVMDLADIERARASVLKLLGPSPTLVDDLIRRCQLSAPAVVAVLIELELAGRIESVAGGRVAVLVEPGDVTSR